MSEEFENKETVVVKEIDGKEVEVHTKWQDWFDCSVGTNGYHGGDTGHGGRAYFRLGDLNGGDITVKPIYTKTRENVEYLTDVEFQMGGDAEIHSFLKSLEYAVSVLKSQIGNESNN